MIKVKRLVGIMLIMVLGLVMVPGSLALADGAPDIEWTRQFGTDSIDYAERVYADSSGIYVAGWTGGTFPGYTNAGSYDAYIRKYDADGNESWTRQFGTSETDYALGVYAYSGGVYVVGYTYGAFPGYTNAGDDDAYIRKYDADGIELWTRQFGSSASDWADGVYADSSGVYVVGGTWGTLPDQTSAGSDDAFIRKYDADGNELWTRQFGTDGLDYAEGVSGDSSGIYVVGWTGGTLPDQTNSGGIDAFIRKYDASGTELWTRQFGSADLDYAYGVSTDPSGVYVVGDTRGDFPGYSNAGSCDVFIRKYDAGGTEQWTRQFGTASGDHAWGVSADSSGVYVVGDTHGAFPGYTNAGDSDAFIRGYDAGGTELWTYQFGTDDYDIAQGVSAYSSGVCVVGRTLGSLPGQTSAGGYDAFVVKFPLGTPPTMQTWLPHPVCKKSAKLRGYLANLGSASSVDCYFEWGETTAYGNTTSSRAMSSTGTFKRFLSGLTPGTLYHYRAVGAGDGTGYGPDRIFITPPAGPPTMHTWLPRSVCKKSARLRGHLADLGTAASVYCYFEWGKTTAYGNTTSAQAMTATGIFKFNLTGLSPGTTYHYRAVAVGSDTRYGPDRSFTTPSW